MQKCIHFVSTFTETLTRSANSLELKYEIDPFQLLKINIFSAVQFKKLPWQIKEVVERCIGTNQSFGVSRIARTCKCNGRLMK